MPCVIETSGGSNALKSAVGAALAEALRQENFSVLTLGNRDPNSDNLGAYLKEARKRFSVKYRTVPESAEAMASAHGFFEFPFFLIDPLEHFEDGAGGALPRGMVPEQAGILGADGYAAIAGKAQ